MKKNRVVIGMSGGVDSSVAAYLLKEEGYDVIGITMKLWEDDDPEIIEREGGCCSLSSIYDAREVCEKIGIPHYVVNFKKVFRDKVVENFINEYARGRTPNPCILCNKAIKFEELLKKAFELDAYYIATGHYAIIEEKDDEFFMKKSYASGKDQTYALYNMTQEQLRHSLFPLGKFNSKEEVREIARKIGLITSDKQDSQDICFVPDNDYPKFINKNSEYRIKYGNFVDKNGNILGRHNGIINYTIGQRKGLGLALGYPAYVIDIDAEKDEVVIGENEDIFKDELYARDINFINIKKLDKPIKLNAKIRYSAKEESCTVYPDKEDRIRIIFDNKVRAITPGQSIVFYDGEYLAGGAIIE
ncbi:MAG: tRNA 2-thiouridine(34) synthase MnmA [Andreesenia angusta]|nr:tRNA 2-thiouridine(34) synthase MnmA [Andreesenia angusta]